MSKLNSVEPPPHAPLEAASSMSQGVDLDIDQLIFLAKQNPEAFESITRSLIDNFLSRSECDQLPLRRLQFRIDSVRYRARTPLKACLKISEMMWDSFLEMNDRLQEISRSGAVKYLESFSSVKEIKSREQHVIHLKRSDVEGEVGDFCVR